MYHEVILIGNVGRDPELRYLQNGVAVCDFSIAVNKKYTANGERREETTWFRVTCWRQLAETVNQYVKKGQQVFVVGEVKATAYLDKSGQPAATLEVTANTIRFLGGRGDNAGGAGGDGNYNRGGSGGYEENFAPPGQMDDIPF